MLNILEDLEKLNYELATESRLVRAGLKETMNSTAILKRYPHLEELALVKELKAAGLAESKRESKERLIRQYFTALGLHLASFLSQKEDEIQTSLAQAVVDLNGTAVPYHNVYPLLTHEKEFERREALGAGLERIHQALNPSLIWILDTEMKLLKEELGYKNYVDYVRDKKELTYHKFASLLEGVLARTTSAYLKAMIPLVEKKLRRPFKNIRRFHVPFLFRQEKWDGYFEKGKLVRIVMETLAALGLDLNNHPNIQLDLEDRPKKNPRACVFDAKVPEEIHLIVKPVGGLNDYETFLHESGHALHYGSTKDALPYEFRHLARSHALSETYAFLLQNLTMDLEWLSESGGADPKTAGEIRREQIVNDLFMFRRYVGKFTAELEFFQKENWLDASLYEHSLRSATQFVYESSNYLFDQDREFYSADYLRAWIAEAQLQEFMKERFSARWFANPKAGEFLVSLWQEGDKISVEDLVKKIGGSIENTAALERRFAELL